MSITPNRHTTGTRRTHRVECWLSDREYEWLQTVAQVEERSMSSTLRRSLAYYLDTLLDKDKQDSSTYPWMAPPETS